MSFESLKEKYVAKYPHLKHIVNDDKRFSLNMSMLCAPENVSMLEMYEYYKYVEGLKK